MKIGKFVDKKEIEHYSIIISMSRNPKFWKGLRATLLVLIGVSLAAAVVCFFTLEGLRQTFFSLCCILLAVNFAFMYGFVRLNDNKRPKYRNPIDDDLKDL